MDFSSYVFLTLMVLLNFGTNNGIPNNVNQDIKCCPKNQVLIQYTLFFYNYEYKKGHLLILISRLARYTVNISRYD